MSVKLLTEQYLEFLSLKGGCTGSSEYTLVKIPYCWKSHVTAQINIRLKTLLQQGRLEHVFYGDFGYASKRIVGEHILVINLKR